MTRRSLVACAGVIVLVLFAGPALADVTISATIEPAVIPVGSEATLVVTIKGKFRKSSQPQLPTLDEITFYQAGSSQSFSIVNGRATSSLQFNYVVAAHKEGRYSIEPIRFETGGNTYTAEPVVLEVVKSSSRLTPPTVDADPQEETAGSPIFIRAWVDRDTVYINEQVTWTLGFYTDGRADLLRSPEFSPPSSEGFWVEDLPPQRNYYKMIDGVKYLVNEIKRGLFPTAPGGYRIGAARVEIVLNDSGRRNLDDFFNRQMRNFGFGKPQTLTTNEMPITVLPLPRGGKPANFSGLVGHEMTVSLRTDKQVVEAGDPVNVTLEIAGKGNFKTMAAPEIPEMAGFKVYESGATSELFKNEYVVSGRKRIEFVLIPQVEGSTVIPPVQISYFDPSVREYKTIQSAPVQMSVKPGTTERGRQVVFTGSGEDIEVLGRDIHFIRPVPAEISIGGAGPYRGGVVAALHVVPLLAVIMSVVVERRRRRWMNDAPAYRAQRAARDARKRLREADGFLRDGRTEEAYTAISSAIRGYLADKMDKSPSGLTIDEISDFLRDGRVREDDVDGVRLILAACDGAKYSSASNTPHEARQNRIRAGEMIDALEKEYFG